MCIKTKTPRRRTFHWSPQTEAALDALVAHQQDRWDRAYAKGEFPFKQTISRSCMVRCIIEEAAERLGKFDTVKAYGL